MNRNRTLVYVILSLCFAAFFLTGCAISDTVSESSTRRTVTEFLIPEASGEILYGNELASIDASNLSEGYLMICYHGEATKAKIRITTPSGTVYTYTMSGKDFETFPLSGGNGTYHIDIYENAWDDMYGLVYSTDIDAEIDDEFKPFLYPNQYSRYTRDSHVTALGTELSDASTGDLDYVKNVYEYIIQNVSYDTLLAESLPTDYVPDVDRTLLSGKGICFDYAALMTALLRSQGIPTRLEVGYSGTAYHAWISVYLEEEGWIHQIILFDGKTWSLMDPTYAANNNSKVTTDYIGDGTNYLVKYSY